MKKMNLSLLGSKNIVYKLYQTQVLFEQGLPPLANMESCPIYYLREDAGINYCIQKLA